MQEWRDHGIAFLPAGRRWDVVKVTVAAVHAVTQNSDPAMVRAFFVGLGVDGPIFAHRRRYFLLVPPGTAEGWNAAKADCLGDGYLVVVPRITSVTGPGMHWLVPPDGSGALCSPAAVRALLDVLPSSADDSGEER